MSFVEAVILAIIEGLTEFLPISSTGHMIIASSIMGIAADDFVKLYTVAIQFGAILSVVVLYYKRFFKSFQFYVKLLVAFIPAAIAGLLLGDYIDALLENVVVVGTMLLIGGVFLLFVDKLFPNAEGIEDQEPDMKTSLFIGFFQVIALVPGVSRSAATIIGGLANKLNRKAAAEFSFFLAVPTMFAATVYKLYQSYTDGLILDKEQITLLIMGNVIAFIVALVAIRTFIYYLTKYGFKVFGIYRIIVGLIILLAVFSGMQVDII